MLNKNNNFYYAQINAFLNLQSVSRGPNSNKQGVPNIWAKPTVKNENFG